ncbi:hypothetical protein D3C78_398350 [compost metagenome]
MNRPGSGVAATSGRNLARVLLEESGLDFGELVGACPPCSSERSMKMLTKEGVEMVNIKSITRDEQPLVIKGKVMGAMTTTILVNPEDSWQTGRPPARHRRDPAPAAVLFQGWLAARRTAQVKR